MIDLNILLDILIAIGTIAVAILAIWGQWFREIFASPKLELKLRSERGNMTTLSDGKKVLYYHLEVTNKRRWALAKGVQVVISGVWRRAADGNFKPEILAAEVPLTWVYPQFSPLNPNIRDQKVCDLGSLEFEEAHFKPSCYFYPNNFSGYVGPNQAVRYEIIIRAENFSSKTPTVIEINWNGNWDNDLDAMERHLVITEIE